MHICRFRGLQTITFTRCEDFVPANTDKTRYFPTEFDRDPRIIAPGRAVTGLSGELIN